MNIIPCILLLALSITLLSCLRQYIFNLIDEMGEMVYPPIDIPRLLVRTLLLIISVGAACLIGCMAIVLGLTFIKGIVG